MLFLVIGPPAAGKTTWVRQHAQKGDIIVDYDTLAAALTPLQLGDRELSGPVAAVTKAARKAAIDMAVEYRHSTDVYVIHAMPSARMLGFYERLGAQVVTIDPGERVVLQRCKDERPWQMASAAKKWYRDRDSRPVAPAPTGSVAMPW